MSGDDGHWRQWRSKKKFFFRPNSNIHGEKFSFPPKFFTRVPSPSTLLPKLIQSPPFALKLPGSSIEHIKMHLPKFGFFWKMYSIIYTWNSTNDDPDTLSLETIFHSRFLFSPGIFRTIQSISAGFTFYTHSHVFVIVSCPPEFTSTNVTKYV